MNSPKILKIALTGGPGGGKTELLHELRDHLTTCGLLEGTLSLVTQTETASELILAGLDGRSALANIDFQAAQLDLQRAKEAIYLEGAKHLQTPLVLLVCDRGTLDGKAFIDPEQFDHLLKERNLNEEELLLKYDAIIHLTTAAKASHSKAYTLSNNPARKETPAQAADEDERLIEIYRHHPCHIIIPAEKEMDEKRQDFFQIIDSLLSQWMEEKPAPCVFE